MAQRVPDSSIRFSSASRSSRVVTTRVEEDDETITMTGDGYSVTLVKREDPDRVTRRTLTRNYVPPKREGKRKHYRRPWAGENQTKDRMRAIYGGHDEEGVERDQPMQPTRPEDWTGTRSPEATTQVIEGEVEAGYQDPFWRAV